MDIIPEQLRYNSEFKSLSPQEQTEVIEYFAERQPESTKAVYLDNANKVMEEMSRESGVGRVYVENKVMDSLKSVLPDGYNDLDKDSKLSAIDKALPILEQRAAEIDPVNKNDTAFYARRQLTQEMRSILGEDVSEVGDKSKRFLGGVIQSIAAPFDEEGTREFLARNLPTKPEYDETNASVLTQAAGDFVGQIGMIIGAAAAITATGGTAGVAFAGSTALGLAQNSSRKFQENYNLAKADMGLSDDEALAAGMAGIPGAVIDSFGDALLLRGIKLGTVSKAFKSMTATEKAAEIVAKGGSILKDPKALRTFGANFIKGGLAEGVSESLGDAATAWGGYATSGHEGFKPSAESLWQSFWVGGLLGGTFNSIANTGKDMKNTRSLKELGKLDQAQFVALGEDAQTQIADLMDKENYTGALEVVKKFKSLVAPAPTKTPAATSTATPAATSATSATATPIAPVVDAQGNPVELVDQEEKSDVDVAAEQILIEDGVAGTAKNLRVAPENQTIAGLKQSILSAVPNALNAVRAALQISPETTGQQLAGQKVTLGELTTAITSLQQEKSNATKAGKKQKDNQQQPKNATQGGQAAQTGDSNSAQQGEAPEAQEGQEVAPELTAEQRLELARNMTPEQNAEALAGLRAKYDADQKLTPEQRAAKVKEGVATEGEASPSFIITPNEAVAAQEEVNKILAELEKQNQEIEAAKKNVEKKSSKKATKKSAKKAESSPEEDQVSQGQDDNISEVRNMVLARIANLVNLAQYKSMIKESFVAQLQQINTIAESLRKKATSGDLNDVLNVNDTLDDYAEKGQMINQNDVDEIIEKLESLARTAPSKADSANQGIARVKGAAQGGLLFQDDQGADLVSKNPKYKALSELNPKELEAALSIVKALQALGINDEVSDVDKALAIEINQAINSGSFSEELISKLNEAAPSRAIFQNQVYNLKGFGKTTKDTIMKHFDVMALNFLKTGNSLQAFWARVPDITVVDAIKGNQTARGALITQGLGGRVVEDQGGLNTGNLVADVGVNENQAIVDIPFSPVPNRIVLVRGKYNASTIMHENDHNMIVTGMAQQVVEAQDGGVELWGEVLTELGAQRGDLWTVAQHEKWVRAREAWINGGEVKSVFTRVFNALKTIFTNLYTSGALTKHRNPVLEKAFVKIYDIDTAPVEDIKAKVSRETGYEASKLLAHVPATKLEHAQRIMEAVKLNPDLGAAKAELIVLATTIQGDAQVFTDDEVFAMLGVLEQVYTGKQVPLGLPLYDEVDNHFAAVKEIYTYYGAVKQKGKPRDQANVLFQDSSMETVESREQVARHTDLEQKFNDGTITEEEAQEAKDIVEKHAREAGYTEKGIRAGVYKDGGLPMLPSTTGGLGSAYYAILGGKVEDVSQFAGNVTGDIRQDPSYQMKAGEVFIDLGENPLRLKHPTYISDWAKRRGLADRFEKWLDYQFTVNEAYKKIGTKRKVKDWNSPTARIDMADSLEARRAGRLYLETAESKKEKADALLAQGYSRQKLENLGYFRDTIETSDAAKLNSFLFDQGIVSSIVVDWGALKGTNLESGDGREFVEVALANPNQIKSAETFTGVPLDQRFNKRNQNILFQDSSMETVVTREHLTEDGLQKISNEAITALQNGGTIIGKGGNNVVYDIPNSNYVIRIPKSELTKDGNPPEIKNSFSLVEDLFNGRNFGQVVAKSGRVELLIRQSGVPAGIDPLLRQSFKTEDGNAANKKLYDESIKRIASMPQSAFDKLASDLRFINDNGFMFDPSKANNILVDTDAGAFNIVDVATENKANYRSDLNDMLVPLMDNAFANKYADESLTDSYSAIFDKSLLASAKAGILAELDGSGRLSAKLANRTEVDTTNQNILLQDSALETTYLDLAKDPEGNREALQAMVDEAARSSGKVKFNNRFVDPYEIINRSKRRKQWSDTAREILGIRVHPVEIPVIDNRFLRESDFPESLRDFLTVAEVSRKLNREEDMAGNNVFDIITSEYEDGVVDPVTGINSATFDLNMSFRNSLRSSNAKRVDAIARIKSKTKNFYSDSEIIDIASNLPRLSEIESEDSSIVFSNRNPIPFEPSSPVTYDNRGNIIPLGKRFNQGEANTLFQDSSMETVEPQTGVPYSATVYRATPLKQGDKPKIANEGALGSGIYLAGSRGMAEYYLDFDASTGGSLSGRRLAQFSVNLQNPIFVDNSKFTGLVDALESTGLNRDKVIDRIEKNLEDRGAIGKWVQAAFQKAGYDGIIARRNDGSLEIVAYSANSIVETSDIIQQAIAPRTTNQLFQQDGAVGQRPTNFNSIVDIVQAIKEDRTDTPLKAVNKVIAESIEFRDRVKAESERRKQPRKVGVESIIERISRERSSGVIDTDTARNMISFVNSINPNLLEDTSISIRNKGRSAGTYDFVDNLVTLYQNKNGVTARTTSHEFWHGLSRYLSSSELNEIKKDYVRDLNAYIKKNPSFLAFVGRYGLTQEEYDAYEFFASESDLKQLTKLPKVSPEGHAYSINFTKENYRFVMLDEYFAERMADLTESKNKPKGDTLISKMANLIREFLSIIKQSVSKDVYDNFYNAVMSDTARLELQRLGPLDKPRMIFNPERSSGESSSILYQFAGETAQRPQFLTDSLDAAKAMAAAGKTQEEIRAITGWFPSPYDGKMRWEIPDDKAKLKRMDWFFYKEEASISDILNHQAFYEAYPDAKQIKVKILKLKKGVIGAFDGNNTIKISGRLSEKYIKNLLLHEIQHWIQSKEGFARGSNTNKFYKQKLEGPDGDAVLSQLYDLSDNVVTNMDSRDVETIINDVNSYYQKNGLSIRDVKNPAKAEKVIFAWRNAVNELGINGLYSSIDQFEKTKNKIESIESDLDYLYNDSYNEYVTTAGEIEARNIEARANLTPEQRAAIAPYSSENIAPEEAIVLFQDQESSGYSDSAIRSIIGMGHSMLQMSARLGIKIKNNQIQKEINALVNSQNNRSGKPVKGSTVQKAASALLKRFQEFHKGLEAVDQDLLVQLAYEKSFAIEEAGLDADSLARRNNIRKRKGQPIEEEQRVAVQDKIKKLYNTFRNARTNSFFKNNMKSQISPEFRALADRILSLVNRGLDNVMGAFNSTNEDLLLRFADNIEAYNKKPYEGTPEFIEQFNQTVTEVEEEVMEHLVRQYYAYNSAYVDAEGISEEINALVAQLQRMPEEGAMEWYERMVKIINQIEAAMFTVEAEGNPDGQSDKDKAAAKSRAKRESIAKTHQAALLEKFPTVEDFIAYKREQDGGVLTQKLEDILRDNYTELSEAQIEDLSNSDLKVFNSTALTIIVGGSNTQFLTPTKRKWRENKVASWHALVESMTDRVGDSPLVRSIYRSASRSNFLERQLNNFDKVFQANVENFHVWIDRFSQYAPVRNWFDRQFFADFQANVFVQAENARKAAETWSQETIESYNDDVDNTVDANPYLWVMSMLSQYNLGEDPNKGFSKAVTRARTSIQRTIDQNRSARLVSEANRNLVALNYMLEGINIEADNSHDLFMNNATVGNRIGAGNEAKANKRLELLSNITSYFQQDIANQKFIRENIFGKPFQTVVNYLPLKALKVDGSLDEWDWTSIEPKAEYQVAAQNVNARSNEERVDDLGQDRAYGMDFFNMVERKAVKNALDKHAILPVAILSDIFKTEEKIIDGVSYRVPKDNAIKTIFGSQPEVVNQLSIIKEKITHQMVQIYGATEPATGFVGGLKKALGLIQGSMLSGVGQIAQQSTAAVVDYSAREEGNIGYMIDAMIYWSKNYNKYRDWLLKNDTDLYERGNTQGIREFERHVNNAGSELNSMLDKGWQGIDQIRKFMTISLRYGDKIGAELIFLAEHMKAVKQSGQMPTNGDYDIDSYSNPYYTAQAQGQLAKFVGPSSAAGRSYWMSDHKQHYFLLRSLTGSFQSSAHNMSSQMLAAARNIVALQSDKSPEGRAERIAEYRKIGSIMAQQATFTGVRHIVGAMMVYALAGAIKDAWDDEDGAIEEAQLELEEARNKYYPSKAAKDMAVTMAERKLADARSIRKSVIFMKQQASGDSLMKSMVRDQLQNLHIVGSVGDGFAPKIFMMVPNSMAEQSHKEAQDLIVGNLKKEKSEALAMGDRRKAAKIGESIVNAQAVQYIPYFYDKKDKSGFGGIVGGMLDPVFTSVKEGVEDMTRADKDFLTARAFVPDMITYMAALGLGQADVNRIARQLQRMDDELSKNRDSANERAGKEVDKLTNKPKTPFLR